ncbi:hypothetical protein [Bacillus sp. V5-8f]|uniref:hypothetical protein n=1 Tax=Bacillus sp. V5-8f TaxID=2053044 RepID=UPI0015E0DB18|nr:hypothetical protein [Bacillus sp. V5-8f]
MFGYGPWYPQIPWNGVEQEQETISRQMGEDDVFGGVEPPRPLQYGGQYGVSPGGQYGVPSAGQYGSPYGGQYGGPSGGQYSVPPGSQYGSPYGGQYGVSPGGQYDSPYGGQYGGAPGGQYGSPSGGQYDSPYGGQYSGAPGGQYGTPSGGQSDGPPTSPPPSYVPQMPQTGLYAVDPGSIRRCLYRFTYVWLRNGRSFWFYPTYIGRTSVAGYRWRRNQNRWVYTGIDTGEIRSFQCS